MPKFEKIEEENNWLKNVIKRQARLVYMLKLENSKKKE